MNVLDPAHLVSAPATALAQTAPDRLGNPLPVDSDLEVGETDGGIARPVHLRWEYLALVLIGGTVGTALRELLSITVPPLAGVAVVTVGINLTGAFLLGTLLEALVGRGPDEGRRRHIRLVVGTGALGGFTTYSALATDTSMLLGDGRVGIAVVYAFGTLLGGAIATWAGISLASAARTRRADPTETAR
jgi:CrcB protein